MQTPSSAPSCALTAQPRRLQDDLYRVTTNAAADGAQGVWGTNNIDL